MDCDSRGLRLCSVQTLLTCDNRGATGEACFTATDSATTTLWTSDFMSAAGDSPFNTLYVFKRDNSAVAAGYTETTHNHICCARAYLP